MDESITRKTLENGLTVFLKEIHWYIPIWLLDGESNFYNVQLETISRFSRSTTFLVSFLHVKTKNDQNATTCVFKVPV